VGISVDSGVDVAKEAADIILLEKSLLVLVKGVIQGRLTYGNSIKYIKMAVSSNFGNVFSVLIASAWLPFLPMLPEQLLVQNLLYDFSQIAIPWDNMDSDWMMRPCTWDISSILKFMAFIGPLSSIFDMATFSFMWFYYGIQTAEDPDQVARFQTAWFIEGLLTQTLIVHMIRTAKIPFIQSIAGWPLLVGTSLVMVAGIATPFIPGLRDALTMVAPPGLFFAYLLGVLLCYCLLVFVVKTIYIRIFKNWM